MKKLVYPILILILILLPSASAEFSATPAVQEHSTCAGSTVLYTIQIEGTADITVTLDGAAGQWATAVPQGLNLQQETQTLYIYVTPNSRVLPGQYNLNVQLSEGDTLKTIPLNLIVNDCHGLEITGQVQQDICSCNSGAYEYTITNQGNFQEVYDLTITGESQQLVTLSQNVLVLTPGESSQVQAIADLPCDQTGTTSFSLNTAARTSNAVSSYSSNINSLSCYNYDTTTDKDFVSFCEHSLETVTFTINNIANTENKFNLELTGPGWANLERDSITIPANQKGNVNLLLTPDFRVKGDFEINVNIEDEQGKIKQERLIRAKVRGCNGVSLEILKDQENVCQGLEKQLSVSVENIGEVDQSYNLASNQQWATIDNPILSIPAGESINLTIQLNPGLNVTSGDYTLELVAEAVDSSKVSDQDNAQIEIIAENSCYKPTLTLEDITVSLDGNTITPITLENQGKVQATYTIGIIGTASSFSQVNPAVITIDPGKAKEAHIYVAPPITIDTGTYKATVTISRGDLILEEKTIDVNVIEGETLPTGRIIQEVTQTSSLDLIRKFLRDLFGVEDKKVSEEETEDSQEPVNQTEQGETIIEEDTTVTINEEEHTITIMDIQNETVTILIESDPVVVVLEIGEPKEVDINGDGETDIQLILEEIKDGKPKIRMIERAQESKEEATELTTRIITGSSIFSSVEAYKNLIILGVIILVIIILLIIFSKQIVKFFQEGDDEEEIKKEVEEDIDKELNDDFDDDFDEDVEEQDIKIGRYIFLLIIIGAIVFFWIRNDWTQYITIYKNFIIIGLVLLLLILISIRFWDSIVKFFEEEDEEPLKKVAKKPGRPKKR